MFTVSYLHMHDGYPLHAASLQTVSHMHTGQAFKVYTLHRYGLLCAACCMLVASSMLGCCAELDLGYDRWGMSVQMHNQAKSSVTSSLEKVQAAKEKKEQELAAAHQALEETNKQLQVRLSTAMMLSDVADYSAVYDVLFCISHLLCCNMPFKYLIFFWCFGTHIKHLWFGRRRGCF